MTEKERAAFKQIEALAEKLQQARTPRESVEISRRLLAVSVSLSDASTHESEDRVEAEKRSLVRA